jgi:hypothetical protein
MCILLGTKEATDMDVVGHVRAQGRPSRFADRELRCVCVRHPQSLLAAFRLIHERYVGDGLMRRNRLGVRILPHQLLDTTWVLVAEREGEVVGTLSVVGEGELGLPIESICATELTRLRRGGRRVAELSCLATKYVAGTKAIAVLRMLLRSALRVAADEQLDELAICVHPRHADFYEHRLGFRVMGGAQSCPWVCGRPAVAMSLNVSAASSSSAWAMSAGGRSHCRLDTEPSPSRIDGRAYFRRFLAEASPFPLPDRRAAAA